MQMTKQQEREADQMRDEEVAADILQRDKAVVAAQEEKKLSDAFGVVQLILDRHVTGFHGYSVQAVSAAKIRNPLWQLLLDTMVKNGTKNGTEKMAEARKLVGMRPERIET